MPESEETPAPDQSEGEQPTESQQSAQEAEGGAESEQFDAERAKKALSKKNSENENLRRRLKELEPLAKKAQELEDAERSESERLTEQLRVAEERVTAVQQRAVRSEVRALASSEFADPEDAPAFLDLAGYVGEDGEVDADQIRTDLKALLKAKPHLAKPEDTGPRRPAPDRSQGSSGNGNRTPSDPAQVFAGFMNQALERGR